jgi:5-methylcytosine-specific restriction endonuclease McrA
MQRITRKAAKAAGLKYYFTGKPCKRGHIDKRFVVTRRCMTCNSFNVKEWVIRNPEANHARVRRYQVSHREAMRRIDKKWSSTHRGARRKNEISRRARKKRAFIEHVDPLVVFERDKGMCGICGITVNKNSYHIDHVIPLSKGGAHCYANVQLAHAQCNIAKRDALPKGQATLFQVVTK